MKVFTYNQYIKYIHKLRLNTILQVAEESEEYHLEGEERQYLYDKLIKTILNEEEEARKFINYFIEPQKFIETNELIRYTNNKSKEADLIYKLKGKEIFFLIEQQSTADITIQYKILNYCIDIIQKWSRSKKTGKNVGYPIVVPIVIYTGDKNWKIPKKFNYMFESYKINLEYNLVDINKLSKQELLAYDTILGHILLIKKSQNKEELIDNLCLIIKTTKNKDKLDKLADIIMEITEIKN